MLKRNPAAELILPRVVRLTGVSTEAARCDRRIWCSEVRSIKQVEYIGLEYEPQSLPNRKIAAKVGIDIADVGCV